MEHIVFFPAQDGSPAFRRTASLDDAVRLVEHLRNVEQVADVSLHAMTEVPLAFRAYYKVEVAGVLEGPSAGPPDGPSAGDSDDQPAQAEGVHGAVEAPSADQPVEDADLPPLVTVAQQRPGVRNAVPVDARGLGFFAS